MKKILFLTTTNLASNPRLVKELRLATAKGFKSTVVQFTLGNWSDAKTNELEKEFSGVVFIRRSGLRKPFVPWLISSILQKLGGILPVQLVNTYLLSIAVNKRAYLLLKEIKKMKSAYTWVVAHNPGAFYPAQVAAKHNGGSLGIDIEDYHPGESNEKDVNARMRKLMRLILPEADYCSYAAPLIAEEVQRDIPTLTNRQLVVLNGFAGEEFTAPVVQEGKALRLVWFSQNIDFKRGLEPIIPVINELYPDVELYLIGNLCSEFANTVLKDRRGITIHPPQTQEELHQFLSTCDIGLALDVPVDYNRELALTNKIIAYAQAGLYILATPTKSHIQFLTSSQLSYHLTDYASENLQASLQELIAKKAIIHQQKEKRFKQGRVYDWEDISIQLADAWSK